jgi:Chaperone of endosialidase
MRKKNKLKKGLFVLGTIVSLSSSAQWALTGNNLVSPNNKLGSLSTSVVKPINIITNGVSRIGVNNSFRTDFFGNTGNSLRIDAVDPATGIFKANSRKNLGLYAGDLLLEGLPSDGPSGDIYMKSKNIFMQYSDALLVEGDMTQGGRVLIGEPTTFVPNALSPKLQVKGDNIGLVNSLGTFGSTVLSTGTGFSAASKWLSLGARQPALSNSNLYGLRAQWSNYALDLALIERGAAGTVQDASLIWQDGSIATDLCATALSGTNSAFRFIFRNGNTPSTAGSNIEAARFVIKPPTATGGCSNVAYFGINNTNPVYELDVKGQINASGSVRSAAIALISDQRFKKEIVSFNNGLEIIRQLKPVNYKFNTEDFKDRYDFDSRLQYGFIAQDLEKVIPSSVVEFQDGYKGVNYIMIIPILTNAIKTMDTELQALKGENAAMKRALGNGSINNSSNENTGSIKLFQNIPNPFGNSTIIEYVLGNDNKGLKLVVADLSGKTIQVFENLASNGKVEVKAESLNNGIYLYSLVNANNEVMMSKQMLVQK